MPPMNLPPPRAARSSDMAGAWDAALQRRGIINPRYRALRFSKSGVPITKRKV